MKFLNEMPFMRQALHARLDAKKSPNDTFKPLKTRDSRLFYILSGNGSMKVDGTSYDFQDDMLILFKAGTEYEWQIENANYYAINFDYSNKFSNIKQGFHPILSSAFSEQTLFDCGEIEDVLEFEETIILSNALSIKHLIRNIITESGIEDKYTQPVLDLLLKQLLFEVLRLSTASTTDNTNIVKQVVAYLHDHYSENVSNSSIAERFGYNPIYLGRIFKNHTGMAIHEFLIELRLKAAAELLANSSLSIGDISKQVGIPDIYHFSKFFKNRMGCTPTKYRNQ